MGWQNLENKVKSDCYLQMLLLSLFALSTAYLSEISFNMAPCILCIYQRIPYFIILVLSCFAIFFKASRVIIRYAILACFAAEIFFSFYHVGIEHYIFEEDFTCKDNHPIGNMLSTVKLASSCSKAAFKFMNLSMAEWNLIYAVSAIAAFIYQERKNGYFFAKR